MIKGKSKINQGTYKDFNEDILNHLSDLKIEQDINKRHLLIADDQDGNFPGVGDAYARETQLIIGQIENGKYFGMKTPRLRDPNAFVLDPKKMSQYIRQNINGYFNCMYNSEILHPAIVFKFNEKPKIKWDRLHILDGQVIGLISNKTYYQFLNYKRKKIPYWSFTLIELVKKEL